MNYYEAIDELCQQVADGISEYAVSLNDLDGLVFSPIGDMRQLSFDSTSLPVGAEQQLILDLLDEAEEGAFDYAANLYDTTDCTEPLDRLCEYLGQF